VKETDYFATLPRELPLPPEKPSNQKTTWILFTGQLDMHSATIGQMWRQREKKNLRNMENSENKVFHKYNPFIFLHG